MAPSTTLVSIRDICRTDTVDLINALLQLISKSISNHDEAHIEALTEIKQHVCFQLVPVAYHWLNHLFVLLIVVLDHARLLVEACKWVRVARFLGLHPVVHLNAILPGWILELVPDPFVNWPAKLWDDLWFAFLVLSLFKLLDGDHLWV